VSDSFDTGYVGYDSWNPSNPESPIENLTGWRFREPFPCDTEEGGAVNQYRTRHYGAGERVANPIDIDSEMESLIKSYFEVGESSGVKKKKKKMRGQVERNPPWVAYQAAEEEGVYPTEDQYASLSSYFWMTNLCLGTSSDSDYVPTGRTNVPNCVRKTSHCTGWIPSMYAENNDEDNE
jgi:hypothetical protein